MIEFSVKNYDGQIYLKGDFLKDMLNSNPLKVIPSHKVAIFFSGETTRKELRESLEVALKGLKLDLEIEERGEL